MFRTLVAMLLVAFANGAIAGFIDARTKETPAPMAPAEQKDVRSSPVGVQQGEQVKAGTPVPAVTVAPPKFDVREGDRTIREVLARWAKAAGWVHDPVHWAVTDDYSIAGYAGEEVFGGDFRSAVRVLISSTELTARAAQPCFYSNNVVRVIPRIASCTANIQ